MLFFKILCEGSCRLLAVTGGPCHEGSQLYDFSSRFLCGPLLLNIGLILSRSLRERESFRSLRFGV